ncbi:OprD family outer membrane porin [Pontibacter anaerobius]|uniref:OprD family outer membrane porin n=1 Tax=Pontibacter anaerobius TaxID=2993940 RepID=A0ABT3RBW0_9BACT|nr:OprD family outer membrane porin [Pontibacter anaerobius]MCX2739006.1 OprD family outer membrane porin [Pontibacter anaerobius]
MLKTNKIARTALGLAAATLLGVSTASGQGQVQPDSSRAEIITVNGALKTEQASVLPQDTVKQTVPVPEDQNLAESKPGSIKSFLQRGKFSGHVRNFFMYTDNTGDYPDYHALAMGAGLYYESAKFHGLQVGAGGFFVFNAFSSDLGTDPQTGLNSRYEIGLFDLLDPDDKHDLGRMESLFLRYNYKKSRATLGRQKVVTPFLNPQDGRMRPSLVEALWLEVNELEKLRFQGGWVFGIGPRSTQDFFSVEESIGSIPVGRSAFGGPSQFRENISSAGMAVGQLTYMPVSALKSTLTHYFAENLFNFTFSQTDVDLPLSQEKKNALVLGLQAGYQTAAGDGGNEDPLKAYIEPNAETWLYSGRLGYKTPVFFTSLNYTRIGDGNRWLFPREWGIETFYTFMPRERLEGTADTRMVSLITDINLNKRWKARIGYGHADLPDVKNLAQNKYAMPSYSQLQLMTNYSFQGRLDGLALQALYIRKGERGKTYETPNFIVNKVDMSHLTLVMNYTF